MMSSNQIAQMNHHAFSMGYGSRPGLNGHESISGITPFGHGAGTQAGVGLVGGMSSAANTLSMAGLGALGGKFLLNKLGIGAGLQSGLGTFASATGATLPMAASLGLVMPGIAALGGMASGAQQYSATQNTLDRTFGNRLNMGGSFGYGVGREDARQLTEAMRSMKAIPEMMTSMGELQDVLNTVSTMGVLQGVRDASEFKNKFTSMVHALRDMSRDLGSTMKEATALFSSSVGQGFMDVDQAMINARMAKSGSGVGIGMDTNRMMGLQSGGASFLRSMGADSRAGAFGARDFATSISVAQEQGLLSSQDILSITGKTGEQGVADLSQSLMKAQVNLFQNTGSGRFLTAALAKRDEDGMFTGKLDQNVLKRLRSGQISGKELMRLGQASLSGLNDEQALSFRNEMERGMGASAGSLAGVGGTATALSAILDEMGADNDEAARALVQKMTGVSQRQADVMINLAKNSASINKTKNNQMVQAAIRDRSVSFFKESMLSGQLHHTTTALQSVFVDPFQRAGTNMATRASRVFDEISDEFVGGSALDRASMLTVGMPKNMFRLMFDDPSRGALNSGQVRRGTSTFLSGLSKFSDRDNMSMGELMDNSLTQGKTSQGALVGRMTGGAIGASVLTGMALTPGLNVVAAGALLTAGVASGFESINSMNELDDSSKVERDKLIKSVLGDKRGGKLRSFKALMSKSFTGDQRASAMDRLNTELGKVGSVSDIRGMGAKEISKFVGSLSSGDVSGLETLSAAGGLSGADAKNARDIAASFKAVMASGGSFSSADAENEIEGAFTGGPSTLLNDTAGTGGLVNGAYFMSETARSLAMSGDPKKREALLKLLENKDVAMQVIRNKDNPEELERLSRSLFNNAISKEELKMIGNDMAKTSTGGGGIEYDSFSAVADRIRDPSKRMILDAEQQVAQAGMDSIREGYGSAGGEVSRMIQGGGLFKSLSSISSSIMGASGGGSRLKTLQEALKKNIFSGSSESSVMEYFKKRGISRGQLEDADIVFDDNLTEDEQLKASRLSAMVDDLSSDISSRSSSERKRAERLGLTPELQLKIAEQYEKAIEASEKSMAVHTDAIVKVTNAVAKIQTTQGIGTELTS